MTLSLIGYAFVPLGILLFISRNRLHLLYATILTSPLVASTIIELGGSTTGLQPSYFFGALLIMRTLPTLAYRGYDFTGIQRKILLAWSGFASFSALTLTFPIFHLIDGTSDIFNSAYDSGEYLSYPYHALTQFIYLIYFLLLTLAVATCVRTPEVLKKSVKFFIAGVFFSLAWGLFVQLPSYFLGFDYPYWLFNNHPGYAQGFDQKIFIAGIPLLRISSTTPEPSMFAYILSTTIALLVFFRMEKRKIFESKLTGGVLITCIFFTMIITTSTTAIVGLLLVFLSSFFSFGSKLGWGKELLRKFPLFLFLFSFVGLIMWTEGGLYWEAVKFQAIDKIGDSSSSVGERFSFFTHGLGILASTYGLGAGYGVNSTADLLSTLLSNVGFIGFFLFLLCNYYTLAPIFFGRVSRTSHGSNRATLTVSLAGAYTIALLVAFLAIPGFIFTFPWLLLGLIIAQYRFLNLNPTLRSSHPIPLTLTSVRRLGQSELPPKFRLPRDGV